MTERTTGAIFGNVQVLRAVAAYMVVAHHIANNLAHYTAVDRVPELPGIGARGVEIFFVISGFIMVTTTDARDPGPGRFLLQRIVRIVPIYWLLTFVAIVAIAGGFQLFNRGGVTQEAVLASMFFLPDFQSDGAVTKPILVVGWTLNYEMMFYAIFAACLFVRHRARIWLASGAILALWLIQVGGTGGIAGYWGADIVLAFVVGMAIARLRSDLLLSPGMSVLVIGLGAVGLVAVDFWLVPAGLARPEILSSLAAGAIVLGAVSLDRSGHGLSSRWLKGQGDASYSIYLVHPFLLQLVGKIWLVLHWNRHAAGLTLMVLAMLVLVALTGTVFHRLIELPTTARLRRWSDRRALSAASFAPPEEAFDRG